MPDGTAGFTIAETVDRPQLQVLHSDLTATARELRDLLAASGRLFDRGGVAVRLAKSADTGLPVAVELGVHDIVVEAHRIAEPVEYKQKLLVPVTLPERVANLYLSQRGDWRLPALDGVTTAPVLAADGTILARDGYDPELRLWCARVPSLSVPVKPSREDAKAALERLRARFRTFPFADSTRVMVTVNGVELSMVDIATPPWQDETAALCGLLTAVCRPSLFLAPGFLCSAPPVSGAGSGKGLLIRAINLIAFGLLPQAFTKGSERGELDKRLVAELIEAAPSVMLDNVNGTALRNDTLASVLTERPARVRVLGRSLMVRLNSTAWITVTGNGLSVSEDLARRFLNCTLDPQVEDPETRPFPPGYLDRVLADRPAALTDVLTIWRWGRQNAAALTRGKRLGSYETWCEWVRDPLLTLGCADPVDRIQDAKASDPQRKRIAELLAAWFDAHSTKAIMAKDLDEGVRLLADPAGRGRQFLSTYLDKLDGTRAAGFIFKRHPPAGRWGTSRFAVEIGDWEVANAGVLARQEAADKPS